MADGRTLADRLRNGLARIDAETGGMYEGDALKTLRRSVELTLDRLEAGGGSSQFRFQNTGGKPLLFHGHEALPLEPERLFSLLNAMDIILQPGEALDLDGGMAAWLIRPEVNQTDSNVRQAEEHLRVLKSNRDNRDHAAIQAADSARIRLRTRLTQLVGALQIANKAPEETGRAGTSNRETAVRRETSVPTASPPTHRETSVRQAPLPAPPAKQEAAVRPAPLPPAPTPTPIPPETLAPSAPPPPAPPAAPPAPPAALPASVASSQPPEEDQAPPSAPQPSPPLPDAISQALRRILAAINGCGLKSAVIGDVAHVSWGFTDQPVWSIELIAGIGEKQQETFLSAARGEGLFTASSSSGSVSLRYIDKKLGTTANVEVIFAVTPGYWEIINRAKPDFVLNTQVRVASCEDLIVLRAGSDETGHRDSVIHLLRTCANRIDPTYLKAIAKKLDVLDELKSAWQEAKKQVGAPTEASGS